LNENFYYLFNDLINILILKLNILNNNNNNNNNDNKNNNNNDNIINDYISRIISLNILLFLFKNHLNYFFNNNNNNIDIKNNELNNNDKDNKNNELNNNENVFKILNSIIDISLNE
jgi:hypothetical protein